MPEGHLLQAWNDVHEIMDLAWSGRPNDVISSLYIPFYMDYPQSFEEPHYYWMTVQTEEAMYDGEPAAHMEREIGDRLKGIESPLWTEMVPEWRVKAKFLPRAIAIARRTLRIVKQNIIFALGVKAVILILGALGYAGLWAAVFADVGVAVIAILNAMRAMKTGD
jgi:N-acetyl-beta-hexosaminidase